jgi:uncharacterized protein
MKIQTLQFPFTLETVNAVNQQLANAWNSNNPDKLVLLFSPESRWQCGEHTCAGRDAIKSFLIRKWSMQHHYRHVVELWAFHENRISNRVAYEWQSAEDGQWFRATGVENLEYEVNGLVTARYEYICDTKILEAHRWFK